VKVDKGKSSEIATNILTVMSASIRINSEDQSSLHYARELSNLGTIMIKITSHWNR
jgi:hypothetical protein